MDATSRSARKVPVGFHVLGHEPEAGDGDDDRDKESRVEGAHDPAQVEDAHEERPGDRPDDAHGAEKQGVDDPADLMRKEQRPEQDRGDHGHGVRFEEVGRHARAVTDVVADVVRNDRGVARIVLGDAGLDFAHEVRADVSRLGVDPTTQPGEHRDEARAEGEAH